MQNSGSFLDRARAWMTPERAIALQGIGMGLSQIAQGQAVNLSPAHQALADRQQRAQQQRALDESGLMTRFTPDQQAILAQMEPGAAQALIAQTLFAPKPKPTKGVEINGQLVDPVTGQIIGDYRTPEAEPPRETIKGADGYNYYLDTGERVLPDVVAADRTPLVETNITTVDEKQITPGQKIIDETFADVVLEYMTTGQSDANRQAAQIKSVLDQLTPESGLTGPGVSALGDFGRAVFNPEAQDAKDTVESVVQRNLREILGGQFAQQEGERLIARAYNVALPPEMNAARLRALFLTLEAAAKAKQEQIDYWYENGETLSGYRGSRVPSIADFEAAIDAAKPATPAEGEGGENPYLNISEEEFIGLDINSLTPEQQDQLYEALGQ